MSKEFGRRLAILRNNCEFTQKQVADALHIDRSTYAYYELGHTEPDFRGLVKLARIFNVSPAALIPEEESEVAEVADVSKPARPSKKKSAQTDFSSKNNKVYNLSAKEKEILSYYRSLDDEGRKQLLEFADKITEEDN